MSLRPSWRLQTKVTLVFSALVTVLVAIFFFFAVRVYESEEKAAFELRALSLASLLGESATNPLYDLRFDQLRLLLTNVLAQTHVVYVYAYDKGGRILADGTGANRYFNTILDDPFHSNAVKAEKVLIQYKDEEFQATGNVLDVAQPIFVAGGEKLGGVRIGFSLLAVQQKIAKARWYTFLLGVVFAVVGGILTAVMGRRLVRPIENLVRATQLISSGNLDVKISLSSRDELGMLAESFNRMAGSLRENEAALKRKVVEARTLYEIGQEITAQVALEPTLHLVVERARDLLDSEISLLALRQEESDSFAIQAYSGTVTEALAGVRFRAGEGLGGRVVATGSPVMVGDYLAEYRDSPFLEVVKEAGIRSAVAVPLRARDVVTGVLYVDSRAPYKFREEDQQLLSALADHAAIAIENAKLYQQVKQYAEALEAKVEVRTRELQEVNRRLEAAGRHKSQFLASMSHELRTPLNAIIGFSEILLDESVGELTPEERREFLGNILSSGRHLLRLINDILDLSKVEAGRMELRPEEFSIAEVVSGVLNTIKPLAARKQIGVEVAIDSALTTLVADQGKVKQILYNLLSNAIKFTPEKGQVGVRISGGRGEVCFAVWDTGIGIKPEDQARIFEEFHQVEGTAARQYEGTGLGLALAKKFVELHAGRIWVESEPGKGSTFTFTMPLLEPSAGVEKRLPEAEGMGGPLVLVVEDDPKARELLRFSLSREGFRVEEARDGEEAVTKARALQPFLITLDILLPKKDGWEVLRDLKEDGVTQDIPVVIVSIVDERERGFSLGAADYIVKPFDREDLLRRLKRHSFLTLLQEKPVRVLIIDDDPLVVEMLAGMLEPEGFGIFKAYRGQQGLELAVEQQPDLILLDLLMPEISGFEVVQRLKEHPQTREIPIFVVTAKDLAIEDKRRLNSLVAAVMPKGAFSKEEFLEEIWRLMRLKAARERREPDGGRTDPAGGG